MHIWPVWAHLNIPPILGCLGSNDGQLWAPKWSKTPCGRSWGRGGDSNWLLHSVADVWSMFRVSTACFHILTHSCAVRVFTNKGSRVHSQGSKQDGYKATRDNNLDCNRTRPGWPLQLLMPKLKQQLVQAPCCLPAACSKADVLPFKAPEASFRNPLRPANYNGQSILFVRAGLNPCHSINAIRRKQASC